jgi:hypothetical protein
MKNPLILELRRIRDAHAKKFNYDLNALGRDWMRLDREQMKKAVTLRGKRIVPVFCRRKASHSA